MYNLGEILAESLLSGMINGAGIILSSVAEVVVNNPVGTLVFVGLMAANAFTKKKRYR